MELGVGLLLISPTVAFIILLVFGRRLQEQAHLVSLTGAGLSFIGSLYLVYSYFTKGIGVYYFNWFSWANRSFEIGFIVDGLSALVALTVAFLIFFIQLYSRGYMRDDPGFPRFYAFMSLFALAMLGLVTAHNYLQFYVFWELVGFCSYLLIGFWYERPSAAKAAKKAFLTTRLGDIGFLFGLFLLWSAVGSLSFGILFSAPIAEGVLKWACILIFLGAIGKSAQFPLHVWLPDAMEGPTPVSALLHSATMVAAGVYLVARSYPLFIQSPVALEVVAIVGAASCFLGASLALVERNIKRILAYSTISQLGYMMIGLGVGTLVGGIFHFFTHAFFKALLFLCAGSLIHAYHSQDIKEMGGAWSSMPLTALTCLAGSLALAGLFPFSGFFSKDAIIAQAFETGHPGIGLVSLGVAFLTAFYIFRLFFNVFAGRLEKEVHEPEVSMQTSQVVLASLALISGLFGTSLGAHLIERFLGAAEEAEVGIWAFSIPVASTVVVVLGIILAWLYCRGNLEEKAERSWAWRLLDQGYYIEPLYRLVFLRPAPALAGLFRFVEVWIVDGTVRAVAKISLFFGEGAKSWQSGQLRTYITFALLGLFVLILFWWWF
jgi:NADH-quinone oxidoreductase subunit L